MKSSHPILFALLSSSLLACAVDAGAPPADETPAAAEGEQPPAPPPPDDSSEPPPSQGTVYLTRTSEDPPSVKCGVGADRVERGLDLDHNGVLDPSEVTYSDVTCKKRTTPRRAFLSSVKYKGDLGGLAGADAKCQALADAVPELKNGVFLAWLSTSTESPATRFNDDAPFGFVRVDGVKIADNLADLLDGYLHNPLNVTEQGDFAATTTGPTEYAWSDTTVAGQSAKIASCSDWTSTQGSGLLATPRVYHGPWAGYSPIATSLVSSCDTELHLYCFEQ